MEARAAYASVLNRMATQAPETHIQFIMPYIELRQGTTTWLEQKSYKESALFTKGP